jgi:phage-related protein
MPRYAFCVLFLCCFVVFFTTSLSFSQDELDYQAQAPYSEGIDAYEPTEALEGLDYAYGEVVSIDAASKMITVNEYDYEADKETTMSYAVADDVELENVSAISEIKPGDYVEIDYLLGNDGVRTAIYLFVDNELAYEDDDYMKQDATVSEPEQ